MNRYVSPRQYVEVFQTYVNFFHNENMNFYCDLSDDNYLILGDNYYEITSITGYCYTKQTLIIEFNSCQLFHLLLTRLSPFSIKIIKSHPLSDTISFCPLKKTIRRVGKDKMNKILVTKAFEGFQNTHFTIHFNTQHFRISDNSTGKTIMQYKYHDIATIDRVDGNYSLYIHREDKCIIIHQSKKEIEQGAINPTIPSGDKNPDYQFQSQIVAVSPDRTIQIHRFRLAPNFEPIIKQYMHQVNTRLLKFGVKALKLLKDEFIICRNYRKYSEITGLGEDSYYIYIEIDRYIIIEVNKTTNAVKPCEILTIVKKKNA